MTMNTRASVSRDRIRLDASAIRPGDVIRQVRTRARPALRPAGSAAGVAEPCRLDPGTSYSGTLDDGPTTFDSMVRAVARVGSAAPSLATGEVLGETYELIDRLGGGGMAGRQRASYRGDRA